MPNKIAVVDFSWCLHRFRHAYADLSYEVDGKVIPTGHIYGTFKFINELSDSYKRVILAVDSNPTIRKEILSSYKSNRKKEETESFENYDVHKDSDNVLALCCSLGNVLYIKEDGYEADDIIGTLIRKANKDWDFYFRDDDILQNVGEYNLCVTFGKEIHTGYPVSIREHLLEKYGLNLDSLPILWKVVKGDSGDCIPIGIERFPSKILVDLCMDKRMQGNDVSFESIVEVLLGAMEEYGPKLKEAVGQLRNASSTLYKKLEVNYKLVKPMILETMERRKMEVSSIEDIFKRYGLKNF